MQRRLMVGLIFGVVFLAIANVQAEPSSKEERDTAGTFPITVQFSPVPDGPGWRGGDQVLDEALIRSTIGNIIAHGFTSLYLPQPAKMGVPVPTELHPVIEATARERGMKTTWSTHGGLELFNRRTPPKTCVYSTNYVAAVQKNAQALLAPLADRPEIERVFAFQDEPFHQGVESFGTNDEVKVEFRKRYGYDLPDNLDSFSNDPAKWLDIINFRSDYFSDGWRKTYKIIKEINPNFKTIMTHDSHGTFGAATGSNCKLFVDDVYHWGGDFADIFVFDTYPYIGADYRYGDCRRRRKPRMSQFHYAFAQMRNLTSTYNKELGFWFGTCSDVWFPNAKLERFRNMTWFERETATTAVAQGADFLITGWGIPQDAGHWQELGKGLNLIQKCGPGLRQAPRVKAKAAFLFPRTQCIQLQEEYFNVGQSFELFMRAFGELDVVHEEQVVDDTLCGYQILCLFDIKLLPEQVAERIASFVNKGGVVIADCLPQMGEQREPLKTFKTLFGVEYAETGRIQRFGRYPEWRGVHTPSAEANRMPPEAVPVTTAVKGKALGSSFDFTIASPRLCHVMDSEVILKNESGQPALIRRTSGNGTAWLLGFCAQDSYFNAWKMNDEKTRTQLYELLNALAAQSGIRSHVHSSNPELEASLRANEREAYLFVIDHEAPIKTTVVTLSDLPFKLGGVTDMETGEEVPFKQQGNTFVVDSDLSHGVTKIMRLVPVE